ncbi:MAG: restriction endonuclease [Acidimicrobiia bacterium]|nr:restriction endonuclease [Acidimicrobiia bacterium]
MEYEIEDYQGAGHFFGAGGGGEPEWQSLAQILTAMPLFLKASGQQNIEGRPIFDPVATNAYLTTASVAAGWSTILVPATLPFGSDWEAGRNQTLAEWQFSNYPYLCNNVLRADVVFNEVIPLIGMGTLAGLVIVTRTWSVPASNGVLIFEQARAQLQRLATRNFTVPVRLAGFRIPPGAQTTPATWTTYASARSRTPVHQQAVTAQVTAWSASPTYGLQANLLVT